MDGDADAFTIQASGTIYQFEGAAISVNFNS